MDLRSEAKTASSRIKQAVSARAKEIWEQSGRPSDRDLEFWLQAEAEIGERSENDLDVILIWQSLAVESVEGGGSCRTISTIWKSSARTPRNAG